VDLDFGTEARNRAVQIPWGPDIASWEQATVQRNAVRAANTATTLELVALGGELAGLFGRGSGAGAAAGVVGLGALTVLTAKSYADRVTAAEWTELFPQNHLLSMPLAVPPGLFAKRWILLDTSAVERGLGCISSCTLSYQSGEQKPERVLLRFSDATSEWQPSRCRPATSHPPGLN
jgi:hypothetical protein